MANRRFIDFPIASTVGDNDIVLIWQDGLNKQTTKGTLIQGAPTSLEGLTDVDIAGLINGQILQYNSVTGKWENVDRTGLNLSELGDVSIVSPSNGQVLVYNSTTSKWENSSAGYVPYVGAVTTVDLGAQTIQAGSFVKDGGTSAQFLKANGSVDSNTYLTTGSAAATYVPYTGATADVNLGTHDLTAERGTFQNNGSSDTLTVNHTSGSGKGINVSKGGNGEALLVTKTSGSGNAMAVVGGRTALVDLSLSSVSNATGNFLTISGGVVHQRTPSETRSDVGAQAQLNGTGFVKASGTTISYDNSTYQVTSEKGQPNGYASLDSNGKVPLVQINDALIGNVNFQGLWNAATNTPTLANPPASGTKGYYYIVSTAGTFASISFEVGDWIISDGTAWGKVDNTDAVSSVFGRTGNVTAANGDYTTAQVTESGNLYYTDGRARGALSFVAGSGAYNSSTGVITIPTNNNQITNGAGYITTAALGGYVTLDTTQTITGQKTISRFASSFNGTVQSFLIDGQSTVSSGNQAALTLNSGSAGYAYQNFAQGGVSKFEIGIIGTGGNGSFYINRNIQTGETGASIFIKKADGFVGINNINPSFQLDVTGNARVSGTGTLPASFISSGNETIVRIQNTGTSGREYFLIAGGNGGAFNSGQFGIYDATAAVPRLAITSAGNVAIGTNNSDFRLQVFQPGDNWHFVLDGGTGQLRFGAEAGSGAVIQARTAGGTTRPLYLQRDGSNVLIGTTTDAGFKLDVNGTGRFSGQLTLITSTSQPLVLNNQSTENYLFINSVTGREAMTQYYNPTAGNWYTGIRNTGGLGTTSSYHIYSSTFGNDVFVLNTDGTARFESRIGIGVSAATSLHVQAPSVSYGQIRITSTSGVGGEASMNFGRTDQGIDSRWTVGQGVNGIGNSFGFYTGGAARVNITTSGNLLIGTTTSTGAKLEINGDIRTGALDGGYVSGYWKLGRALSGSQPSETHQIIVEINGALFSIGAAAL
jgi:hypothetical protein